MFDSGYPFALIDKKKINTKGHISTLKYNFHTDIRRYIVEVEIYDLNVYVLKYYADCHSQSKNKYRMILNEGYPGRIIRTCIDIMLYFYSVNPLASFGFIGINSINKKRKGKIIKEDLANTQRFRIYKRVMANYFGKKTFWHSRNVKYSAYLMINKKHGSIRLFKAKAEIMFSRIYVNFLPA